MSTPPLPFFSSSLLPLPAFVLQIPSLPPSKPRVVSSKPPQDLKSLYPYLVEDEEDEKLVLAVSKKPWK